MNALCKKGLDPPHKRAGLSRARTGLQLIGLATLPGCRLLHWVFLEGLFGLFRWLREFQQKQRVEDLLANERDRQSERVGNHLGALALFCMQPAGAGAREQKLPRKYIG